MYFVNSVTIFKIDEAKSLGTSLVGRPTAIIITDNSYPIKNKRFHSFFHSNSSKIRYFLLRAVIELIYTRVDMIGTCNCPNTELLIQIEKVDHDVAIILPVFLNVGQLSFGAI